MNFSLEVKCLCHFRGDGMFAMFIMEIAIHKV